MQDRNSTLIRAITAVILIAVFVLCMGLGRYTAVLFFTSLGCIACWEMANALHQMQIRCSPWPSSILLVLLSAALLMKLPIAWSIIALALSVIAVLAYALFHKVGYENVLGTLAIFLYPMLFFVLFAYVGEMELDKRLPILAVIIVSASLCDMGAYFVGRKFGKHKLAPEVSPKKTIEGSVAGLVCGTLSGIPVYFALRSMTPVPLYLYVIVSLLCSVSGEVGDLCASMIKRQAGIKDYSNLLPGHGGVLDRADSFVFALPVALLCFELFFVLSK